MKLNYDVKPENEFFLNDGRKLKNLNNLVTALNTMDETTFRHHVNSNKNDFHNWVRDIYGDKKFARKLLAAETRSEMRYKVQRRIMEINIPEKQEVKLTYMPRTTPEEVERTEPKAVPKKESRKETKTKPLKLRLKQLKKKTRKTAKKAKRKPAGKAKKRRSAAKKTTARKTPKKKKARPKKLRASSFKLPAKKRTKKPKLKTRKKRGEKNRHILHVLKHHVMKHFFGKK